MTSQDSIEAASEHEVIGEPESRTCPSLDVFGGPCVTGEFDITCYVRHFKSGMEAVSCVYALGSDPDHQRQRCSAGFDNKENARSNFPPFCTHSHPTPGSEASKEVDWTRLEVR